MQISHSGASRYLECPRKFFLHTFLKLRAEVDSSALIYGNSVDIGLNTLLETRDLAQAKAAFGASWLKQMHSPIKYSKADLEEHLIEGIEGIVGVDRAWYSLNERGLIMLEEFNAQIIPKIKRVLAVQIDRNVKNSTGDKLVIKTDFVCEWEDGRILLCDNKTSSSSYPSDSVRTSEQLAAYFELLKDEYKLDACAFIVLPKRVNKRKLPRMEIKVIIDTVAETTIEKTFIDFDKVLAGVKDTKFEKNENSCMTKFGKCIYWEYCRSGSTKGLKEISYESKSEKSAGKNQ